MVDEGRERTLTAVNMVHSVTEQAQFQGKLQRIIYLQWGC